MEQEIKRMRYYDGLFLKEGEFIDEQKYHLHMRRRINFALYHYGVMEWYRGGLKVKREGDTGTRVRINPGMALDRNSETMESREIILREPQIIDLSDSAYPDFTGQTVYITIKYRETAIEDPPSEGPVPGNTRIVESAEITATADPPVRPLSPFEVADNVEEVILATVRYNSMEVDETEREYGGIGFDNLTKELQDLIAAGAPAPLPPTLVGINPDNADQGSSPTGVQITGDNLTGTLSVRFEPPDGITVSNLNVLDYELISFDLQISAAAPAVQRTFRVTTPAGTARSEDFGVFFTVNASAALQSITISADNVAVSVGAQTQFTAIGHFSTGPDQDITNQVSWTSSNTSAATIDNAGLATSVAEGTTDITATLEAVTSSAVTLVVGSPVISPWPNDADRRRHGTEELVIFGNRFAEPLDVAFPNAITGNPNVIQSAAVDSPTQARVIVPGPFIPSPTNPPVVRSGQITVSTTAGTSVPSPQAFILITI